MPRYQVTLLNNQVTEVLELPDQDEEYLGIEWALSELRDTYRHSKSVSATFSLGDKAELDEFLATAGALVGKTAAGSSTS
jgi:hypothetical protein